MLDSERRSTDCISRREEDFSSSLRSERIDSRVVDLSVRVVLIIGMLGGVVWRRCRVRAWPIPLDEGVIRIQAMTGI